MDNKERDKIINKESTPDAGTRYPAGKPNDATDALHSKHEKASVRDAKEVAGAAQKCIDKQIGRTPGKIGDATTQPNSGGEV